MTDFRLANRWLAIVGGALNCALTIYIWSIVGEAKGPSDLGLALAQCSLVAIGGYLAASLLLRPGLQRWFGYLALLLPASLWAITFACLFAVALGNWSKSPMLVFALLLPIQSALLVLGAAIFELIALLSHYLTSRSTRRATRAGERRR